MTPHTLPMKNGRVALLHVPSDCTQSDFNLMKRAFELIGEGLPSETEQVEEVSALEPPVFETGPALWHVNGVDVPVTIAGYLGLKDDRHYLRIEGSSSGVPLDEVVFLAAEQQN